MVYILSCETIENGGGIYSYELTGNGILEKRGYFSCDRPMYAVKCGKGLCVLLRQPFENSEESGYFYLDENLQNPTQIRSTQGKCACHLCVDENDVYIVNYLSGNLVKNGTIVVERHGKSVHPIRQSESHTHFVDKTPDGYLVACDLGMDTLAVYNKNLKLIHETKVPSGYGIRHLAFSKGAKYIYAINELVPSIRVFSYSNSKAELIETVIIECKNTKTNGAAIRLSKDGKFLYVSLREENKICVFAVDNERLTLLQTADCGGDGPRDFNIFGEFLICANEISGSAIVHNIRDGLLIGWNHQMTIQKALCVL